MSNTDSVGGDHANSPKVTNDTYTSAAASIFHTTPAITIAEADFGTKMQMNIRITALVPAATALTGEARFIALMMCYTAYSDLG